MSRSDKGRALLIPAIEPVPEGVARPFWSVMMPVYNCSDHFELALRSVLEQDPGADRMQITVVDDCSTNDRAREIVDRLARGRVEFHRQATNGGLARNWNSCLERSRGAWVHLFHQDDLVLPGFYEAMERAAGEHPEIGAAFCRHGYFDGSGVRYDASELERPMAGILDGWLETIAVGQRIECPSIVVRRAVYEKIGGFTPDLYFALDWEMWVRIAASYPVWYEPAILAYFRRHEGNETARLARSNRQLPDMLEAVESIMRLVPPARRRALHRVAERNLRWRRLAYVNQMMGEGRRASALMESWRTYRLDDPLTRARGMSGHARWALKGWLRDIVIGRN